MSKIIITNDSPLSDEEVMWYIRDVMKMGRCSKNDTAYCAATVFKQANGESLAIFADMTRSGADTFRAISYNEKPHA